MTSPNGDASRSDPEVRRRIAELTEEIARFNLERQRAAAEERELRAREDPAKRISFANEIHDLRQDQLRLQVEIDLLERKIRRLELGYAEDYSPQPDSAAGSGMF